ncbi:MAG: TetR/AcrR family transcriptional regulator [Bacilli bacterium]|nr:TetR/AcrR family transcriptional regulator [Bacilli bacterium]
MRQNNKIVSPMSNEGRNTFVLDCLTEALLKLLKEKKLIDISITELIDKAGVGRASFYRNFKTKEDILIRHADSITKEFVNNQKFKYESTHFYEYVIMLFEHLNNHRQFETILMKNNLIYIIENMFDKYFLINASNLSEQFRQMYIAGGFYNVFKFWLMNGCKETPTELADMFIGFIK